MNKERLKEKYPEIWEDVRETMAHDLRENIPKSDNSASELKEDAIQVIAHNAAFLACNSLAHYIADRAVKLESE